MPITNVALEWLLRVQVPRVQVRVTVVRVHAEQATCINQLARHCDRNENEKRRETVVTIHNVSS